MEREKDEHREANSCKQKERSCLDRAKDRKGQGKVFD
jgi:hypothetical protein